MLLVIVVDLSVATTLGSTRATLVCSEPSSVPSQVLQALEHHHRHVKKQHQKLAASTSSLEVWSTSTLVENTSIHSLLKTFSKTNAHDFLWTKTHDFITKVTIPFHCSWHSLSVTICFHSITSIVTTSHSFQCQVGMAAPPTLVPAHVSTKALICLLQIFRRDSKFQTSPHHPKKFRSGTSFPMDT
jgi:hypothetical protein